MTGGMVSMEMVEGIVTMVNGHLFRGIPSQVSSAISGRIENM